MRVGGKEQLQKRHMYLEIHTINTLVMMSSKTLRGFIESIWAKKKVLGFLFQKTRNDLDSTLPKVQAHMVTFKATFMESLLQMRH